MKFYTRAFLTVLVVVSHASPTLAAGQYFEVTYPPSKEANELQLGVTYRLWVPDGVKEIRGVIVHQHGCGVGSNKGAETAAQDLHWQALASKWDCALLGPAYHQGEKDNCRLWCDPRNGSHKTFLQCLRNFAEQTRHPELARVPWCLWGHSGGGFWASLMQTMYPDRIVAIWFRSGTAFSTWGKGEVPTPDFPAAMFGVPMMCNPGAKENGDKRFNGAWVGNMEMFKSYREKGAPIGFAPDPRTSHETGDSRYLAIPFFDACLAQRLPPKGSSSQKLKPIDLNKTWLAPLLGDQPAPAAKYRGEVTESVWLPDAAVAKAWAEYVKKGSTEDATPPPAPRDVKASPRAGGQIELTWDAEADFESGLQAFIIQRDGKDLTQVPEKPAGKFGRPLFQGMSYGDTPEKPLREMRFLDTTAQTSKRPVYHVIAVNSVGLKSTPTKAK